MLLWAWADEIHNFWPHQEQSPDLNAGCFLAVMSKYKFSMNHAINWNTVKGNFFDFWTTTSLKPCMAAALLAASGLRFIQSKSCSSMNWSNLVKIYWIAAQTLSHSTSNTRNGFVSSSAMLQYRINCPSSETSIVSSILIPNNWAFFSLSKSCFNKSFELWRYLCLVLICNSGIFFRFFPPCRMSVLILKDREEVQSPTRYTDVFWA